MPIDDTALILTPEQVGRLLECSTEAAARLMEAGNLIAVDFGRKGKKYLRTSAAHVAAFKRRGQTVRLAGPDAPRPRPACPVIGLEYDGPRRR